MPQFIDSIEYTDTEGGKVALDGITSVSTVDASTLSVAEAQHAVNANNATNANHATSADSATNIKNKAGDNVSLASALLDMVYPVGSIYMSVNNVSPQSFLGGTWVAWGAGRVPVSVANGDSDFGTADKTGGEKTHKLTNSEMPSHIHTANSKAGSARRSAPGSNDGVMFVSNGAIEATQYYQMDTQGTPYGNFLSLYVTINKSGGDEPHNNLQPYITCYMWKRTA